MVMEAVNRPVLVEATVATVDESNFIVTVELGEKPVPETVTVELTAPDEGFSVMPGTMVKVADAEIVKASVAVTLCGPFVETGTVSDTLNPPVVPVLAVLMLVESKVIVTVEEAEKPVPVTVNEDPD